MRNRARLMDHSEDWVDGSWTVDCVCGVNFDDGEEMVDCDECGVWVHTRCSRYVKGKKSFACDKCKLKKNENIVSEETEVAQLLVDLPKNTMKMEGDSYRFNDASSRRRPLRLWTEKPMEDRVHVHGIPGGDPQLFDGLSGIFTPQLWKAAGYVPKKFNFRYKEFPFWEQDEEKTSKDQHENQSTVDTGADALCSMSKESVFATRLRIPLGTRVSGKGENFDRMVHSKELKTLSHVNPDADFSNDDPWNKKSTRQSFVFNSCQQRKGLITSQNRTGKRKSRASDKDIYCKKRVRQYTGTGFLSTDSDPKTNGFSGDKDPKVFSNDSKSTMDMEYGELDDVPRDLALKSSLPLEGGVVKAMEYSKYSKAKSPASAANSNSAIEAMQKVEMAGCQSTAVIKGDGMLSSTLINDVQPFPLKEVAGSFTYFNTDQREKSTATMINKADFELPPCFIHPAAPHVKDSQISQGSTIGTYNQTQHPKLEVDSLSSNITKSEDGLKHLINISLLDPDLVNCKVDVKAVSSSHRSDKEHMVQANSIVEINYVNASDEYNDTCITPNLHSSEGCKTLKVNSLENNDASVQAENHLEAGEATHSPTTLSNQGKMAVSVSRSMSTNSVFHSVTSDDIRAEKSRNSSMSNRNKSVTTCNITKERASVADKEGERHRKNLKESPRASKSSIWKSSDFSKISRPQASKESLKSSKDHESRSFAKAKQETVVTSDSGESAGSLQAHSMSLGNCNVTSSGSSGSLQRGRKHSQITNNTSLKTCNISSTNRHLLSASHAALSDEELALLLHQELNSSPRVPRIPRMRQTGSLPQSASPTASNMLSKRTSGVGGNEYTSVSRRKYKDPSGDETHSVDVKLRKRDKGSSSKNQCINESTSNVDGSIKREPDERSSQIYGAVKRKGPSSIKVTKSDFSRASLKNIFDEEIGIGGSSTYRTLPGLISEIMSKGKRMTYEELCNTVLPHWHNLRKHNGERYAYSSHSQAVLDCLRNRSEWAELVDRGPKTNPGRKRRKLDADIATSESEDRMVEKNEVPRVLDNRNISKQQEFPKGKRKARKRRRLALQGKEVKNLRKSRSVETASEDEEEDDSLYSVSMEQSLSSGDDAQGEGSGSGGSASEASVSSDET